MPAGPRSMRLLLVATTLQIIAAVTAGLLAKKRPDYRAVAAFLAGATIANVLLLGFILAGAPTSIPPAPLMGFARVMGHTRQALYLIWPFGLVALFVHLFTERRPWLVGLAYVAFLAVLIVGYPAIRGDVLRQAYTAAEVGAFVVSIGLLIQWGWQRSGPSLAQVAAMMMLFAEAGVIYAAWRGDIFAGWDTGRVLYGTMYAMLAALQGYADTGSGHSQADRAASRRRGGLVLSAPLSRSAGAVPGRAHARVVRGAAQRIAFSDINATKNAEADIDNDEPFDPNEPDVEPEPDEGK